MNKFILAENSVRGEIHKTLAEAQARFRGWKGMSFYDVTASQTVAVRSGAASFGLVFEVVRDGKVVLSRTDSDKSLTQTAGCVEELRAIRSAAWIDPTAKNVTVCDDQKNSCGVWSVDATGNLPE